MPCLSCTGHGKKEEKHYITLVLYLVFLFIVFIAHKCVLMYTHLMVLEYFGQVVIPEWSATQAILVDGIPSYGCAAIVILLLLSGPFVACACSIPRQKSFIMIISVFALVFMCVCTIAQISIVIYKDITLFLDDKAVNVAECFCLNQTQVSTTSTTVSSMLLNGVTDPALVSLGGTSSIRLGSLAADSCPLYYCRCNVPFEDYPIGFSVPDVDVIDVTYLEQFLDRNEYTGDDVITTMVNTSDELYHETDDDFYDMKMLLGMAELSVLFVVLRLPMFVIAKKAKVGQMETKRASEGSGVEHYIFRAIQHVHFKANMSETFKAFLSIVVFAFVESLDSFTLLDDIIEHRYTFGSDRALTLITLSLVLLNIIVVNGTGIVAFLGDKPPRDSEQDGNNVELSTAAKAMEISKLVTAIISNLPFMALRSYLLYVYDGFNGAQIGSVYVIFITKELVLFVLGVAEFAMTSDIAVSNNNNRRNTHSGGHHGNGDRKKLSPRNVTNGRPLSKQSPLAVTKSSKSIAPNENGMVSRSAAHWMTKAGVFGNANHAGQPQSNFNCSGPRGHSHRSSKTHLSKYQDNDPGPHQTNGSGPRGHSHRSPNSHFSKYQDNEPGRHQTNGSGRRGHSHRSSNSHFSKYQDNDAGQHQTTGSGRRGHSHRSSNTHLSKYQDIEPGPHQTNGSGPRGHSHRSSNSHFPKYHPHDMDDYVLDSGIHTYDSDIHEDELGWSTLWDTTEETFY